MLILLKIIISLCAEPYRRSGKLGKGVAFEFPPKTVRWVMFTVEKVNKGGCHVGLSEIAVF